MDHSCTASASAVCASRSSDLPPDSNCAFSAICVACVAINKRLMFAETDENDAKGRGILKNLLQTVETIIMLSSLSKFNVFPFLVLIVGSIFVDTC